MGGSAGFMLCLSEKMAAQGGQRNNTSRETDVSEEADTLPVRDQSGIVNCSQRELPFGPFSTATSRRAFTTIPLALSKA